MVRIPVKIKEVDDISPKNAVDQIAHDTRVKQHLGDRRRSALAEKLPPKVLAMNQKALALGAQCVKEPN